MTSDKLASILRLKNGTDSFTIIAMRESDLKINGHAYFVSHTHTHAHIDYYLLKKQKSRRDLGDSTSRSEFLRFAVVGFSAPTDVSCFIVVLFTRYICIVS